ncbi:MAG TPA: helix-turn-helix transcriptional regulator [Solirubrobacterales bacterium]|jgi:transcriptional regulator with XRE-family HTH domain
MATSGQPETYFAAALRAVRVHAGLTQEELALRIGMGPSEISFFESGRRSPQLRTMRRVTDGLGVSCWQVMWLAEKFESGATWEDIAWPPPG